MLTAEKTFLVLEEPQKDKDVLRTFRAELVSERNFFVFRVSLRKKKVCVFIVYLFFITNQKSQKMTRWIKGAEQNSSVPNW